MWIFGYGSLVWRPDFDFVERHPAYITGYLRRFWQGSTDHRGVPGAPGRVATLIEAPGQTCFGTAYRIEGSAARRVLSKLDVREQGGYTHLELDLQLVDADHQTVRGLVYWASADNPNYLGPAPLQSMVEQIATARGPSGGNADYLVELARALETMGAVDPHVSELHDGLRAYWGQG